jgi:parallel beta-helix repeat protein
MNRTYSSAHRRSFFYSGLILFLFLLGLRSISSAAIWYVAPLGSGGNDSNPGTLAQPFYTLWPAVTSAQPGDTIYARGGTYHYSVGQWLQCSGTASSWITIAAYPGENPVIDGSSMPASQYGLGIGGQYMVIRGFTVQNASGGIGSWDWGHLKILDNTVSGAVSWGIYCGSATFGTSTDILIDGNFVSHNDQANNPPCETCGWPAAISTYWADGVTISNNVSYKNFGEGICITHSNHISVIHNTVYDNFSLNIYLDNARFCTIGSNLIYTTFDSTYYRFGAPAVGIGCANEDFASANPLSDDLIINNVVLNGLYGFGYGNYMSGGGMKNFIVANNTFYGAVDTLFQVDPDAGHSNNLIENNVFYQTNGQNMSTMGGPLSAFTFSHNAWFGGSPGALAGAGDILVSPMLTNPGTNTAADYSPLAGSPLLDAGGSVGVVTTDYLGNPRPQGSGYDIGAFESVGITPTPSMTPTQVTCGYPGPTCTPTDIPVMTSSPTPTLPTTANNEILWPNPWDGKSPLSFYYMADGTDDSVCLKLYTVASRKIFEDAHLDATAGQHLYRTTGHLLDVPADGLYFLVLEKTRAGRKTGKVFKLVILK